MTMKKLKGKGEFDYDYRYDILFFKTKNREYDRSIKLDNIVLDVDKEGFIVGIQIFDASEFLNIPKIHLRKFPTWEFRATLYENKLEVRLSFQIEIRNKIIEKNPIIIESVEGLPNSEMICMPAH